MLQLHLSYQQFYFLLKWDLYQRFYGISYNGIMWLLSGKCPCHCHSFTYQILPSGFHISHTFLSNERKKKTRHIMCAEFRLETSAFQTPYTCTFINAFFFLYQYLNQWPLGLIHPFWPVTFRTKDLWPMQQYSDQWPFKQPQNIVQPTLRTNQPKNQPMTARTIDHSDRCNNFRTNYQSDHCTCLNQCTFRPTTIQSIKPPHILHVCVCITF